MTYRVLIRSGQGWSDLPRCGTFLTHDAALNAIDVGVAALVHAHGVPTGVRFAVQRGQDGPIVEYET